jgi:serine/threonine protein kinase
MGRVVVDGRYTLERELGRGGMGRVYLARDTGLDRVVAIKVIDPELARNADVSALFRREAMALARVRSDHVVQVYAFGTHEGAPFFVMEYVEGADLDASIASYASNGGVVPLHRAGTILRQAASGLAAVHAHGIVHRDIKPSNILVEAGTGRPLLIDFGLAQRPMTTNPGIDAPLGTPLYMAPEQWGIDPDVTQATPATDVYGFGATAYELLTGTPPFVAETAEKLMLLHATAPVPKASATRPSVAPFDAVVSRAMSKSVADRYPDGRALGEALDEAFKLALPGGAPASAISIPPPSIVGSPATLSALVIDDDEMFRAFAERALRLAFEGVPIQVRHAPGGAEGLALARAEIPDLLVLDFDMPGLNGLETLSHLRALPHGTHVRVLVVSGQIERVGRWQFDVLGVVHFVAKPVAVRELARLLGSMRSAPR